MLHFKEINKFCPNSVEKPTFSYVTRGSFHMSVHDTDECNRTEINPCSYPCNDVFETALYCHYLDYIAGKH